MCGMWGWWHKDGREAPSRQTVAAITEIMSRRGPDEFGYFASPTGIALGFRRLSIIDLVRGSQPLGNEDGSVQVTLNGEIYNFRSLTRRLEGRGHVFKTDSDTEVIAHGYEEWGLDVLDELCGMYAIAIWDETEQRLVLARDRLGIKPLYYYDDEHVFGFASDPRTIVGMPGVVQETDPEALALYLFYGNVPAPWSIFKGLRKLRPAEVCVVQKHHLHTKTYWHLGFTAPDRPILEYRRRFAELLQRVVSEHMISDVPLGFFLSGGMDSTAVALAARTSTDDPLLTFNVRFPDPAADESSYARHAASTLGTRHHELAVAENPVEAIEDTLSHFPEPFGDNAAVPHYLLSGRIRDVCTVALSGDGGDEVFGGYSYRRAQARAHLSHLPGPLRRLGVRVFSHEGGLGELLLDLPEYYAGIRSRFSVPQIERMLGSGGSAQLAIEQHVEMTRQELEREPVAGLLNPLLLLDLRFGLPDQMLTKVDVTSMAQSLEVRVPLLDHRIVEFAASLPERLKQWGIGPRRTKRILRWYLRQRLPSSFVNRPKMGFGMPWIRSLRSQVISDLRSRMGRSDTDLPPEIDRTALREILAGDASLRPNTIWTLKPLSVWHERTHATVR